MTSQELPDRPDERDRPDRPDRPDQEADVDRVAVPSEASPGTPASRPADTTGVPGTEPVDAWRQGVHLTSGAAADADGGGQARSGYWDDEDEPERPDAT